MPAWRWIPRILPRLGFGCLLRAPIRKLPRASYTALPRFPAWYSLRFLPRPAVPLVRSIRRFPADRNDASNVCRLSERENPLHGDILTSFAVLAPSIFDSRCNNVKALGICTHSTYERSLTASSTVMKDRKAFHTVKRQKQTRGTAHFPPALLIPSPGGGATAGRSPGEEKFQLPAPPSFLLLVSVCRMVPIGFVVKRSQPGQPSAQNVEQIQSCLINFSLAAYRSWKLVQLFIRALAKRLGHQVVRSAIDASNMRFVFRMLRATGTRFFYRYPTRLSKFADRLGGSCEITVPQCESHCRTFMEVVGAGDIIQKELIILRY